MRYLVKQFLSLWRNKKEKKDVLIPMLIEPVIESRNEVEELIGRWRDLDLSQIDSVFSSDKSFLTVNVRKENVVAYRKYLENVVKNFRDDVPCVPLLTALPTQIVSLRSFFIENGYFTNPAIEMKYFRELVIDYLTCFNEARKQMDRSFASQKNMSLTSPMISELYYLLDVLQQ